MEIPTQITKLPNKHVDAITKSTQISKNPNKYASDERDESPKISKKLNYADYLDFNDLVEGRGDLTEEELENLKRERKSTQISKNPNKHVIDSYAKSDPYDHNPNANKSDFYSRGSWVRGGLNE